MAYPDLGAGGRPALRAARHVPALLLLDATLCGPDVPLPSPSNWQRPINHAVFPYV